MAHEALYLLPKLVRDTYYALLDNKPDTMPAEGHHRGLLFSFMVEIRYTCESGEQLEQMATWRLLLYPGGNNVRGGYYQHALILPYHADTLMEGTTLKEDWANIDMTGTDDWFNQQAPLLAAPLLEKAAQYGDLIGFHSVRFAVLDHEPFFCFVEVSTGEDDVDNILEVVIPE